MEVTELGDSFDEARGILGDLTERGGESSGQVGGADFRTAMESASGLSDFSSEMESLRAAIAQSQEQLAQMATQAQGNLEAVTRAGSECQATASEVGALVTGVREEMGQVIDTAAQGVDQLYADFGNTLNQARSSSQTVADFTETTRAGTAEEFGRLQAGTESAHSSLDTMESSLAAGLDELSSQIKEDFGSQLEGDLDGLRSELEETLTSQAVEGLETLQTGVQDVLGNFESQARESAEEFISSFTGHFSEAGEYAQDEARKRIEEAVQDLIREVVEAVMAELAESMLMAQLGVSVSGALAPNLPQIVATKKLVEIINDVKSSMGGGLFG